MNQKEKVTSLLSELLTTLGLDLNNPSLKDTPNRIAKMYLDEFFSSVDKDIPLFTSFPNEGYDEIIMLDNINFISICSHHFLPFTGHAWMLYIPDKSLVGASKPARGIDFFSRKPQLQEHLCVEAMNNFVKEIAPKGAMLVMRATHGCMTCRSRCSASTSGMTTSAIYGAFKDSVVRSEGLDLIKISIMDRR